MRPTVQEVYDYVKTLVEFLFSSGPEVIEKTSCSTHLSMKFFLLINVEMPQLLGFLTFLSRKYSILGFSEPEKS